MRAFIVLCLVAIASADKLGYNYKPVEHSNSGLSFQPGSGSGSLYKAPSATYGGVAPAQGSGSAGPFSGSAAGPVEYEKEFYSFSAPEGEFNDANAAQRVAGSVKQGLRVIFIKGPENNGLENAALALAKQAAEQKTAIYVLHKQADLGDLANKLNNVNKGANQKPEVHFVKYRTPEDAANAQKAIQAQYDSLGGKSHNVNGGVAPVLNFASQAPVHSGPAPQTPQAAYLPSALFRFRV
uniref:DM5 domain-containing protein n=1 Tax=Musca domestica TaxID=7370 RepID=A0A1I8MMQ7_MUSDO